MSEIVFIRGHAKSGTNWLCKLVNLHPDANVKGEFHFEQLYSGLENTFSFQFGLLKKHRQRVESRFYNMIQQLIIDICGGAKLCGDRTPGNITNSYIPGRKCLYISRDGRDVLVSWTFHAFRLSLHTSLEMKAKQKIFNSNPDYFENNSNLLLNSEQYVRGFAKAWNDFIIDDLECMKKADSGEINLKYMHITYEELHQDVEFARQKIYNFLDLNPDVAKAIDPETKPGFNRIDNLAFNRRGEAGGWRDYFNTEQRRWFEEEANVALNKLRLKTNT